MSVAEPKRQSQRIAEFGIVGVVVAFLSFLQLWLYITVMGIPGIVAYVIQTVVSVEVNYFGNYYFAWNDRRGEVSFMKSHTIFWATRGIMIIINPILFVGLMMLHTSVNYLVAQALVLVINTIINYYASDKLAFRKKEKQYV